MKHRSIAASIVAIALAFTAACSSSPTSSLSAPEEGRLDGGTFGSGHFTSTPDQGGTFGSGHNTATDGAAADTSGRGGTFGSGH